MACMHLCSTFAYNIYTRYISAIYIYTIICVYNNIHVTIADIFGEMSYSSGLLSVLRRTELGGN